MRHNWRGCSTNQLYHIVQFSRSSNRYPSFLKYFSDFFLTTEWYVNHQSAFFTLDSVEFLNWYFRKNFLRQFSSWILFLWDGVRQSGKFCILCIANMEGEQILTLRFLFPKNRALRTPQIFENSAIDMSILRFRFRMVCWELGSSFPEIGILLYWTFKFRVSFLELRIRTFPRKQLCRMARTHLVALRHMAIQKSVWLENACQVFEGPKMK